MVDAVTLFDPAGVRTLRVWHMPQIPCQPFHVYVNTPEEGLAVLLTLARYDLFQLEHKIKPDYCNAQGLEVLEGGEWLEWSDAGGNEASDLLKAA